MPTSKHETYALGPLADDRAVTILTEMLSAQAKHLVAARAQGANMIACLVARANLASVRLCRSLGIDVQRGGTGVFGLLGSDAARLFPHLPEDQRSWLEAPCGPRETKVLLIAGGLGLLSLVTAEGKVRVTAVSATTASVAK